MPRLREEVLSILDGKINEEYIEELCIKNGLYQVADTVFLSTRNTFETTAEILGISTSTVIRRIKKFICAMKKQQN